MTLYGLPFELSDDARKHSGVGLAVELGAEWAPRIGQRERLRLGVTAQRREYSGGKFDDMTTSAYLGPRIVRPRWDLSLLGTGFARWYGGKPYAHAVGGRIEVAFYPQPNLTLFGNLAVQRIDYAGGPDRDGTITSLGLGAFRPLDQVSSVTARTGIVRQGARVGGYANWSAYAAVGYFRELPAGFSVYLEPAVAIARYDARLPVFDLPRRDHSLTGTVTLLNRRLVLSSFTPRVSWSVTRQGSNIPVYAFTKHRVEIGLTRSF